MSRRPVAPLIALVALLAAPALARAEVVAGAVTDAAGGTDNAQQDIHNAAVVYDTSGVVRGAFMVGEAPTYTGVSGLGIGLGAWSKKRGWCANEADVDIYPPDPEVPEWYGGLTLGSAENGPDATIFAEGTTITFEVAAPEAAGKRWNCARALTYGPADDPKTQDWKDNDVTEVFSLTAQEAQTPETPPECTVPGQRVRRGRKVRLRCSNVRGHLTIRFYRNNRLKRAVKGWVGRGGRVAVRTRGLRRGPLSVVAWRGADVLGYGDVRVR